MKILCEMSFAELLDKISILHLKSIALRGHKELKEVLREKKILEKILKGLRLNKKEVEKHLKSLIKDNKVSWRLLERISEKIENKNLDDEFRQLAYDAFRHNDMRYELKRDINNKFGSRIKEVKSYKKYLKK